MLKGWLILSQNTIKKIIDPLLTRKRISHQMKERTLTLPRIISFDYKRPLMIIILTCIQYKSTNCITCFSVKIIPAKKKEGAYRLLLDTFLHSWYVVYVTIKTHKCENFPKNKLHTNKIFIRPTYLSNLVHQHLPRIKYSK